VDTEVDEGVFVGGGAVIVKADSGRFQHAVQYCYWMYELNVLVSVVNCTALCTVLAEFASSVVPCVLTNC
jgi:hypothetical protein